MGFLESLGSFFQIKTTPPHEPIEDWRQEVEAIYARLAKLEAPTPIPLSDPYEIRSAMAWWLRLKIQHEELLASRYDYLLKSGDVKQVLTQLAADIDHSSLLIRLLEGKEPLPEPPPLQNSYPVYPDEA